MQDVQSVCLPGFANDAQTERILQVPEAQQIAPGRGHVGAVQGRRPTRHTPPVPTDYGHAIRLLSRIGWILLHGQLVADLDRTLMNMPKSTSYSDLLTIVDLKSLEHRRYSKALIFFYKCMFNMGPNYIREMFSFYHKE